MNNKMFDSLILDINSIHISEPIKKSFEKNNRNWSFKLLQSEHSNEVVLRLTPEFEQHYYEKSFNYESLLAESEKWGCFNKNTRTIIDLIQNIENSEFKVEGDHLTILYRMKINIGLFETFLELEMKCDQREIDVSKSVDSLSDNIKLIKSDIEKIKNQVSSLEVIHNGNNLEIKEIIDVKLENVVNSINDYERDISSFKLLVETRFELLEKANQVQALEINTLAHELDSVKITSRSNEEKLNELLANYDELREHLMINSDKINVHDEALTLNNQQVVTITDTLNTNFPKEVLINTVFHDFNNAYFTVSNEGKTIRKHSHDSVWDGIYCRDRVVFNNSIQEFSMKIDNVTANSYIMIGFAISGLSKDFGMYTKTNSWMFYLSNGEYYNNASCAYFFTYTNAKPVVGDIVSICIDTAKNLLYVKFNGKICSSYRKIPINETQTTQLYPVIDLYSVNDQVTLL